MISPLRFSIRICMPCESLLSFPAALRASRASGSVSERCVLLVRRSPRKFTVGLMLYPLPEAIQCAALIQSYASQKSLRPIQTDDAQVSDGSDDDPGSQRMVRLDPVSMSIA